MNRLIGVAMVTLLVSLAACVKKELIPGKYVSEPVHMGSGEVRAWEQFAKDGTPVAIGITFDDNALNNLPTMADIANGAHGAVVQMQLPPTSVSRVPFRHIAINWNPEGHTQPLYAAPHFDMHFYMMTTEERLSIPTYSADPAKFNNKPDAEYFPADYFTPGGPASDPEMGTHWIDAKSGELNGKPFTETFIYGSYNGRVNFLEPMITLDFLKATTEFTRSIPWPAKVIESGYYPHTLRIKHENGQYSISIEDMEFRQGQ